MTIRCNLGEFAVHMLTAASDARLAEEAILEKACVMVEKEAKSAIGTYRYDWPQLAESTQQDRARHGFPPNEPLLRTGELRDSIGHYVAMAEDPPAGYVGTNDPIAKFQELGTRAIPPRSFLGSAATDKELEIHEMAGRVMAGVMLRGAV